MVHRIRNYTAYNIYALYVGDTLIDVGDVFDLMDSQQVAKQTVYYWASKKAYDQANKKGSKARYAIKMEEEDE